MSAAPWDVSAEEAVLGVVLNTRHGIEKVRKLVEPSDFYRPRHRDLYAAALAMINVVTLEERVAFAAAFCDATEEEVRTLISASPVMFDATPWAVSVAAEARRRRAMLAMTQAYRDLRDGADVDEVLGDVGAA